MWERIRNSAEAKIILAFVPLALFFQACATVSPATAVVFPEMITSTPALMDSIPTAEVESVEMSEDVIKTQEFCRKLIEERSGDEVARVCLGTTVYHDQHVWVGVGSKELSAGVPLSIDLYTVKPDANGVNMVNNLAYGNTYSGGREFALIGDELAETNYNKTTILMSWGANYLAVVEVVNMGVGKQCWILEFPDLDSNELPNPVDS